MSTMKLLKLYGLITAMKNNMKQQQVIVFGVNEYSSEMSARINSEIQEGWRVVSVTAQHVATGSPHTKGGGYFVVLEKDNAN